MSDPNIAPMGLQVYSLSFGEAISKGGRHLLCILCLESIEKDLIGASDSDSPKGRGRGRPRSPATILAIKIGVSYDTVNRWRDPDSIQACDINGRRLAEVAYGYDPSETVKILRADVESHRLAIEGWVRQVDHQNNSSESDGFQSGGKLPPHKGQTQNILVGAYN